MYAILVRLQLLWLADITILLKEEFVECCGPDFLSQRDEARELTEGIGHPVTLPTAG